MAYCNKCGTENEDDAEFCKKCGTSIKTSKKPQKEHDDRCEENCAMGKQSPFSKIFWGAIVILIGLWIVFQLVIPETGLADELPNWIVNFEFWWLIGLLIAVAFIVTGIQIIIKK